MKLFENLSKIFKKKEVPIEKVNDVVGDNKEDLILKEKSDRDELLGILNSVDIDMNKLALDRIESEADTIASYVKSMTKNIGTYQDFKDDKDKIEEAIKGIGGKIKVITTHSMELKNLLAALEDHYYSPILDALKKLNDKANKDEISKLIVDVEKELRLVQELDTQITKIVGYNEFFNPEKNPNYREEVEKEASKRIINGDLNELLDKILITVVNRSLGLRAKIEKNNPIEKAKSFI